MSGTTATVESRGRFTCGGCRARQAFEDDVCGVCGWKRNSDAAIVDRKQRCADREQHAAGRRIVNHDALANVNVHAAQYSDDGYEDAVQDDVRRVQGAAGTSETRRQAAIAARMVDGFTNITTKGKVRAIDDQVAQLRVVWFHRYVVVDGRSNWLVGFLPVGAYLMVAAAGAAADGCSRNRRGGRGARPGRVT